MNVKELEEKLKEENLLWYYDYQDQKKKYYRHGETFKKCNGRIANSFGVYYGEISKKYFFFVTDWLDGFPIIHWGFETEEEACQELYNHVKGSIEICRKEYGLK